MNYSKEEKDQFVKKYFELQRSEVPVSVRSYAALIGVKYYTFRDWYRDYKANAKCQNMSIEEYSEQRIAEAESKTGKADDGFCFVKISDIGVQICF